MDDKVRAHNLVSQAKRKGLLIKPTECSDCGSSNMIEGHHEDYALPLDVIWLCRKCHKGFHAKARIKAEDMPEVQDALLGRAEEVYPRVMLK